MPTKTVSTYNGLTQTAGAGTSLIISANSLPVIKSIYGYCNGTGNTQYYLQFFNSTTVPANTTVPLLSLQVLGGNGFGPYNYTDNGRDSAQLAFGDKLVAASGLIVCLSTTEATLTIGTGGVTMDIAIEVDSGNLPLLGQTSVGDTTTAVASLLVKADPSTSKLVSFNITNNTGAIAYIQLFGQVPATGAQCVQEWTFPIGATISQSFGGGYAVLDGDASYVIHTGIYLYGSTTRQTFTATTANWTIQAEYI